MPRKLRFSQKIKGQNSFKFHGKRGYLGHQRAGGDGFDADLVEAFAFFVGSHGEGFVQPFSGAEEEFTAVAC